MENQGQSDPIAGQSDPNAEAGQNQAQFNWKGNLNSDMQNSPLVQKFEDTQEGFGKFAESHHNLEQLLGHEKVPIPKGEEDQEGWQRYRKAMGIPESAAGYQLPDAIIPENAKGMSFDKAQFAGIMAKHNATPQQAEGMWKAYTEMTTASYNKAMQDYQAGIDESVNTLRSEWGDTYDTNVELGQAVINQFSEDKETNDYITATLSQDPKGIKFLQKIGQQFAENKIGDFQPQRFSMTKENAKEDYEKIIRDPQHPYQNPMAGPREHKEAVEHVNRLLGVMNRTEG